MNDKKIEKKLNELKEKKLNELKEEYKSDSILLYVIDDILSEEENYSQHIENVLRFGCGTGFVSSLVYCSQTDNFFNKYSDEILELIENLKNECLDINSIQFNKNSLSWFAYENKTYELALLL